MGSPARVKLVQRRNAGSGLDDADHFQNERAFMARLKGLC
jgi:hypothetical protein